MCRFSGSSEPPKGPRPPPCALPPSHCRSSPRYCSTIKDLNPAAKYKFLPGDPSIRGAIDNLAAGHEKESTLAIAEDATVKSELGTVRLVNDGFSFTFLDGSRPVAEYDGLGVADDTHVVLVNSAKLAPTGDHAREAVAGAIYLRSILAGEVTVTNFPPELDSARGYGVVPFLSGNHFSKEAERKAVEMHVIPVVVNGSRFHVAPAWRPKGIVAEPGVVRGQSHRGPQQGGVAHAGATSVRVGIGGRARRSGGRGVVAPPQPLLFVLG